MALTPSNPPRLSVLETTLVAPSSTGPGPDPPAECSLPLTFFDVFWLNSPPVERVFLYRLAPDDNILSNLKTSLSQAIRAFYPLAGRLRATANGRYELHYQPGDGVSFTVAEYDLGVDELSTDDPREVSKIAPLVPSLIPKDKAGNGAPVLAVQATVLHGGQGLAIGVALHHAACDGASSTRFLHTWAAAARSSAENAPRPAPPVVDRTLMPDPRGLYDHFAKALPTADEMEYVKMCPDQLLATFTLSVADTQRVKDAVAAEATRRGVKPPPRCSSLVAAFGFIWSCYQRAKDADADQTTPTYLLFPVDHRSRMKPPLPEDYFGNCVGAALHGAPMGELGEAGAGGLHTACAAVAAAIDQALSGIGTPEMDSWMEQIREAGASGGGVLSVAGSPRFKVYEMDFGFGRPVKVEIVSVARTGAMAVAESRRWAGGIEVGISLPPAAMHRFRNCFHDAIAWLQDH